MLCRKAIQDLVKVALRADLRAAAELPEAALHRGRALVAADLAARDPVDPVPARDREAPAVRDRPARAQQRQAA